MVMKSPNGEPHRTMFDTDSWVRHDALGHLDCVKLLVQFYADINAVDARGGTPLADSVR